MRAVTIRQFGAPSSHLLEELPDCPPGDEEVQIEVRSAGVNFPDLLVMTGKYQILPSRPFTPGKDAAGIVTGIGRKVSDLSIGQRVVAHLEHGGYASQVVAPAKWVHPIPDSMPFADAAAMGLVYQTAYFGLIVRGGLQKGETVLVTGAAGGVGLAAVQIARSQGARVLAAVNSQEQGALALANGADAIVDLSQPNLRESVKQQVGALTDQIGVNVVLDTLGGDTFDGALRALAWCGRMIVIGFAAGRIPEVKVNYVLLKNISIAGLQWSDYRERDPSLVRNVQRRLMDLYTRGAIRPHVAGAFPIESFADALEIIGSGASTGKLVLTVEDS